MTPSFQRPVAAMLKARLSEGLTGRYVLIQMGQWFELGCTYSKPVLLLQRRTATGRWCKC